MPRRLLALGRARAREPRAVGHRRAVAVERVRPARHVDDGADRGVRRVEERERALDVLLADEAVRSLRARYEVGLDAQGRRARRALPRPGQRVDDHREQRGATRRGRTGVHAVMGRRDDRGRKRKSSETVKTVCVSRERVGAMDDMLESFGSLRRHG